MSVQAINAVKTAPKSAARNVAGQNSEGLTSRVDVLSIPDVFKRKKYQTIVARIEMSKGAKIVLQQALRMSEIFGGQVTLADAIDVPTANPGPIDPVDWEIWQREARARLNRLAQEFGIQESVLSTILLGSHETQFCNFVGKSAADLVVLDTNEGDGAYALGGREAMSRILENTACDALLVPAGAVASKTDSAIGAGPYNIGDIEKIIVPLDGSSRAETALPSAIQLAHTTGSELIIIHAIGDINQSWSGAKGSKEAEVLQGIAQRNSLLAAEYLQQVCIRIKTYGLGVQTQLLSAGDVRRQLCHAIKAQNPDMVVLASHGINGHADVAYGDVAAYLIGQLDLPTLLVRSQYCQKSQPTLSHSAVEKIRFPDHSGLQTPTPRVQ